MHVAAEDKLEIAMLEIVQMTAELADTPEDNEHDPFADLDEDEEEVEKNEVVIENNTDAVGIIAWLASLTCTTCIYCYIQVDYTCRCICRYE